MTLRYEDLVTAPEAELRRVCGFIGEAYEPAMLDSRQTAGTVAAAHEWWKAGVAGPINSDSVGRWRREMSSEAQRFAALHLAGYLREHGYEGAQDAAGEVAILPAGDAVGPSNEGLLLGLAKHGLVVARPVPATPRAQHRQPQLVFLGVRGQLDPSRGQPVRRRVVCMGLLGARLLLRRLQSRPMLWVRAATLRERRSDDPAERLLAALLRLLARDVASAEVPALVDAVAATDPVDPTSGP